MKHNHYIITFKNAKTVYASAFNEDDALILAYAIMIKSGFTRELESIKQTPNISDMADTDYIA
jgi:hypothetical protein